VAEMPGLHGKRDVLVRRGVVRDLARPSGIIRGWQRRRDACYEREATVFQREGFFGEKVEFSERVGRTKLLLIEFFVWVARRKRSPGWGRGGFAMD